VAENPNSPQRLRSAGKRLRIVGPCTARGRFRVIFPLLPFRARYALGEKPRVMLPSGAEIVTLTEFVRYRARKAHVSERSVYRWLKLFERGGYAALAEKPRSDRGVQRCFSNRPAVVAFIVTHYLHGWNPVAIHEALRLVWERLTRDSSRLPCLGTLYTFLKRMIPARVLARRHRNA